MRATRSAVSRYVKATVIVISVVILGCAVFVASIVYANWSAEKRAREFCDEIPIGSDISTATARANHRKILWGPYRGYTFYFPGFIFDKAVCEVDVDQHGKVVKKGSAMEYD